MIKDIEFERMIQSEFKNLESNLVWSAYVSSVGNITLRIANVSGSAIDPVSRDWYFVVIKQS